MTCTIAFAQQDSIQHTGQASNPLARNYPDSVRAKPQHMAFLDSVAMATQLRQQFVADSLSIVYIMPDSNRVNLFTEYIFNHELYKGRTFLDIPFISRRKAGYGHNRTSRDPWIIAIIIGLLLYTAFLNLTLGTEIKSIFQSFYSKRSVMDKEDRGINLWAFIGLFLLFGLTFGLFLYQLAGYNGVYYSVSGMQLFIALALIIISLFAFKFLLLKFIGFLFDIDQIVGEYITALYLTYFNIAFVFLPVAVCFSLIAAQLIPYLLAIALILIVVIFIWIYLRSSVNIISNIRFHKFYLFIYLYALEICPILILIKVLNL
ncbi:DUF4271 domain-containing protein [Mucilaginibacter sp.]